MFYLRFKDFVSKHEHSRVKVLKFFYKERTELRLNSRRLRFFLKGKTFKNFFEAKTLARTKQSTTGKFPEKRRDSRPRSCYARRPVKIAIIGLGYVGLPLCL